MNEAQYQLIKVIHKLRLFKGFEMSDVQQLLPICRYTRYEPDEKIYDKGQASLEMLILLKGQLNVVGDAGQVLAQILPGSPVGEIGLFTREPRLASITAAEAAAGLVITKADLQRTMRANQGVYFKILLNLVPLLSERLRDANRLNDKHLEKIMELEDLLVGHTGKTSRELQRGA